MTDFYLQELRPVALEENPSRINFDSTLVDSNNEPSIEIKTRLAKVRSRILGLKIGFTAEPTSY